MKIFLIPFFRAGEDFCQITMVAKNVVVENLGGKIMPKFS